MVHQCDKCVILAFLSYKSLQRACVYQWMYLHTAVSLIWRRIRVYLNTCINAHAHNLVAGMLQAQREHYGFITLLLHVHGAWKFNSCTAAAFQEQLVRFSSLASTILVRCCTGVSVFAAVFAVDKQLHALLCLQ